jgi:hypothetical protein
VEASPVLVEFEFGYASAPSTKYHYVDLWSQRSTWGGGPLPIDGDSIVIPENTTVVVDMPAGSMPKLHTIILFGDLKFDEVPEGGGTPDIHLHVRHPVSSPKCVFLTDTPLGACRPTHWQHSVHRSKQDAKGT